MSPEEVSLWEVSSLFPRKENIYIKLFRGNMSEVKFLSTNLSCFSL